MTISLVTDSTADVPADIVECHRIKSLDVPIGPPIHDHPPVALSFNFPIV